MKRKRRKKINPKALYLISRYMDIDELISWVMKVGRRLIVMKTVNKNDVIKASEIATKTGRSLQNVSYALRELEKYELIRCITPKKSTWKRFIFTEKGMKVFEKLRKSDIDAQNLT